MSDYISREAAIEAFCDGCLDKDDCYASPHKYVCAEVETIKFLPAADVRPVVLCKDCRHRDPEDHKCDCGQLERAGCVFPVDDDYFCAYGEKRGES